MVVLPCYAHQVISILRILSMLTYFKQNLIVGDYFKATGAAFLSVATLANDLISWLRSKPQVLGLIKQIATQRSEAALSIMRAVPTRWTAFHLAFRRLLRLQPSILAAVNEDESRIATQRLIIQGDSRSKARAKAMVELTRSQALWSGLSKSVRSLDRASSYLPFIPLGSYAISSLLL